MNPSINYRNLNTETSTGKTSSSVIEKQERKKINKEKKRNQTLNFPKSNCSSSHRTIEQRQRENVAQRKSKDQTGEN